jgi:MYXO-CTERM domain-containing protein
MANRVVHRDVLRARPTHRWAGRVARPATLLLLGVFGLLAGSGAAGAASSAGKPPPQPTVLWGISPTGADPTQPGTRTSFSFVVAKGGTVSDKVTIYNESDKQLPLQLYATDALDTAEGKFGLIPSGQRPSGVGTWISLLERNVIIPPHAAHITPITVQVPATATPGDHAGAVVAVLQTPESDPSGHQVLVQQQVATPVFVRVAGRLEPQLQVSVSSHYQRGELAVGGGSMTVNYSVRNVGNVRLAAHQSVEVSAPFGITLKTVHLPNLPELLPGAKVTRVATVNGVLPLLRLTTTVRLVPYSTSGKIPTPDPVSGSSSVWAIPWLWLLALLAVGLYVWWRRSRRPAAPVDRRGAPAPAPPLPPVLADAAGEGSGSEGTASTEPQPTGSG